tara:strand:- start:1075 stop:1746 length:672 start_codon:yes stop_codon:yes gene_type:complete
MFNLRKKSPFSNFSKEEITILKALNTPSKIQTFLNSLPTNFETSGDTCLSPKSVLEKGTAHCMEGAMFAAAALRFHGHKPLIVDLVANKHDEDHVIAVFKKHGHWGCISKTNHHVLRYRDPIYKSIRELIMSCFHEYYPDSGKKVLRFYSMPVNLSRFDSKNWMTSKEHVWYIPEYLTEIPHKRILSHSQIKSLREADEIEKKAGDLLEYPDPRKKVKNKNIL